MGKSTRREFLRNSITGLIALTGAKLLKPVEGMPEEFLEDVEAESLDTDVPSDMEWVHVAYSDGMSSAFSYWTPRVPDPGSFEGTIFINGVPMRRIG